MERRIRVKCPKCEAAIELRVDQQELLDVHCPRCRQLFTAKVPPLLPEVEPLEVIDVDPPPPVRKTRVVEPAAPSGQTPRPTRVRQVPTRPAVSPSPAAGSWHSQLPQPQSAPRVSAATHFKALLIAAGGVFLVGLLVLMGFMVKSVVSNISWSSNDSEPSIASTDKRDASKQSEPTAKSTAGTSNEATSVSGQRDADIGDVASKVTEMARQLAQATKNEDYDFVLDRTYPKLVEMAGGRRKMREALNKATEPLRTQGITIVSYTASNNVVVRQVGRKIFAVVPTTMDLDFQGRIMRTDSFLLAISTDAGKTYTFLDGSGVAKNRTVLKQLLPDLPNDLQFPTPSSPREVSP